MESTIHPTDVLVTIAPVQQPNIDGLDAAIKQFMAFVTPLTRDYGSPSFDQNPEAIHTVTIFNSTEHDPRTRSVVEVVRRYGYKVVKVEEVDVKPL